MSMLCVALNLIQYMGSMTGQKPVVSGTGVGQVKTFFFSPLNLLSVYIGGGGNIYIIWDGILEKIIESEARST